MVAKNASVSVVAALTLGLFASITPLSAQCTAPAPDNPCATGKGGKRPDCYMEWLFDPMPKRLADGVPVPDSRRGIPNSRIICYEGDPRCDFDPDLDNNSCTFRTAMCINNTDPRLDLCTPSDVASMEVRGPNPSARNFDAADQANLATLEALAGGGPGGFGVTVVRRDGSVPFSGTPNANPNLCSQKVDLVVPHKLNRKGTFVRGARKISVIGTTSAGGKGSRDADKLILLCRVSTCGNSTVEADHETCDDGNRTNGDGCNQACQLEAAPAPTPTATPPAAAPTVTATATAAGTPIPAACGNGTIESPAEECDDGGVCLGGNNAGTACTSEGDCSGSGICFDGPKAKWVCDSDAECPNSTCVRCVPQGGDGCAANCTAETAVTYNLVPGSLFFGELAAGTSGAMIRTDSFLKFPLPFTGSQGLVVSKQGADGRIRFVIKGATVTLPAIRVGQLACGCVRAPTAWTCGGSLLEKDGSPSVDCTPEYTEGASLCTGLKPCARVHGPGNSATGTVGCGAQGYTGINMNSVLDVQGDYANALDPVLTLSGSGGPGSFVVLNSTAIGTASPPENNGANPCLDTNQVAPEIYGPDFVFCTADDPQDSRGTLQTLPGVSGTANASVINRPGGGVDIVSAAGLQGSPFDCGLLNQSPPVLTGGGFANAFGTVQQDTLGDIVVENKQFAQ